MALKHFRRWEGKTFLKLNGPNGTTTDGRLVPGLVEVKQSSNFSSNRMRVMHD